MRTKQPALSSSPSLMRVGLLRPSTLVSRLGRIVVVGVLAACTTSGCAKPEYRGGIYSPDPAPDRLARTDAAAAGEVARVKIGFCVNEQAETVDVEVLESSGYPQFDDVCADTVETWRFRAYTVDGVPQRTCSTQVFEVSFVRKGS